MTLTLEHTGERRHDRSTCLLRAALLFKVNFGPSEVEVEGAKGQTYITSETAPCAELLTSTLFEKKVLSPASPGKS